MGLGLRFSDGLSILRIVRRVSQRTFGISTGVRWVVGLRVGLALFVTAACLAVPRGIGAQTADSTQPDRIAEKGPQLPQASAYSVQPHARFVSPSAAVVSWETAEPGESVVEFGMGDQWSQQVREAGSQRIHRVTLQGLEPKARYQYRIRTSSSKGSSAASEAYELDNGVNYTVAKVPDGPSPYGANTASGEYGRVAEQILSGTGVTRGYCVVLGCGEGQLAYELAKRSELIIFGVDDDRERIIRGRTLLRQAGVYGSRITLRTTGSLESQALPHSFANLVVADGALAGGLFGTGAQVMPMLQPATGVAYLGPLRSESQPAIKASIEQWLGQMKINWDLVESKAGPWVRARRDLPPGTGSWTHQYGEAGNSANSHEGLGGVTGTDRMAVQWLGRPGADFGVDRNPRMPAPLAVNGRLFHQGLNRIIGLDSYNGAVLWSLEIPALRRVNIPRDAGNWCADRDDVYLAIRDRCWMIGAEQGDLRQAFTLADPEYQKTREWGYVARRGDLLYGSSIKPGSVYTDFWGEASWYDKTSGPGTEKICSDDLFAVALPDGGGRWRYRGGVILNSTIALTSNEVVFVECRNPEVQALTTSRIGSLKLWENQYLVALNAQTGEKRWEQPLHTAPGIVVFYLLAAEDKILLMASASGKYHLYCFAGADGKGLWETAHNWPKDNHGGHLQHPVMVRNSVFLEPCGYDLGSGKMLTQEVGRHGGCATYAATSNALVYRGEGGRISMWDIERGVVTGWHNLRPSCWLSTVPANGMVLSPEGGGGCSCGNWLETSIGFTPTLSVTSK
jgi:hypothetical protein